MQEAMEHFVPELLRRRIQSIVNLASTIGGHRLTVETNKVISDSLAEIGGKVTSPLGPLPEGFSIELVNEDIQPEWNSGWLPLGASGVFSVSPQVKLDKAFNEFRVSLRDDAKKPVKLIPNYFVLSNSSAGRADLRKETVSKP
jgi:hypothetical protein